MGKWLKPAPKINESAGNRVSPAYDGLDVELSPLFVSLLEEFRGNKLGDLQKDSREVAKGGEIEADRSFTPLNPRMGTTGTAVRRNSQEIRLRLILQRVIVICRLVEPSYTHYKKVLAEDTTGLQDYYYRNPRPSK